MHWNVPIPTLNFHRNWMWNLFSKINFWRWWWWWRLNLDATQNWAWALTLTNWLNEWSKKIAWNEHFYIKLNWKTGKKLRDDLWAKTIVWFCKCDVCDARISEQLKPFYLFIVLDRSTANQATNQKTCTIYSSILSAWIWTIAEILIHV